MNWVTYNHGHDVALPGSSKGVIPFLRLLREMAEGSRSRTYQEATGAPFWV